MIKSILTDFLAQNFAQVNFDFLILYGNSNCGNDIDLFGVVETIPKEYSYPIRHPVFDLFLIDTSEFMNLIFLLDPVVSDPLLTGEVLIGNFSTFSNVKGILKKVTVNMAILNHLKNESFRNLSYAKKFFTSNRIQGFLYSLVDISYALSYWAFADYYDKRHLSPITLSQLIDLPDYVFLAEIIGIVKSTKRNPHLISYERLSNIIKKCDSIISRS